jgi:hypothetical protein
MNNTLNEYEMIINNKKIFEFYKNNPSLNFEQINLLCIDLFENILQDATTSINKSISNQILNECLENKNKISELTNNVQLINMNLSKITNDIVLKLFDVKKEYIEEIKVIMNYNLNNSNEKMRELIDKNNNALNSNITNNITSSMTSLFDKNNILYSNDLTNKLDKNTSILINEITHKHTDDITTKLHLLLQQVNSESLQKISSFFENSNNHIIDKTNILINQIVPENNKINKQIQDDIYKFYSSITEETKINITENKTNEKIITDFIKTYNEKHGDNHLNSEKIDTILLEINSLLNNNQKEQIELFISNFDSKYNSLLQTIQQPILQVLSMNDERINKNINKQQDTQEQMMNNLNEFLNKYKNNSSLKGKFSENHLNKIIVQMFPSAEIIDTSKQAHSCDLILKRENKEDILLENKDYSDNVSTDEVNKFIGDCEKQQKHGIILSQNTGITSKKNYHIDIIKNNKILVYIHMVDYSHHKIQTAIDIIDTLADKLKDIESGSDPDEEYNSISKEIINEINSEFSKFITHKETIINMVKDSQKKIIDEIKNLYIPSLEKYLSSKFGVDKITYTCDICNVFVANSKKALSSHKRNKDCKSKVHNMSCFNIELDNNDIIGNMPTPLKKTKKQTKQNKTNNC